MAIQFPGGLTPEEVFVLSPGSHASPSDGLCAMEAVAWLAGLQHNDRPECTSEIIGGYVRHLNDNMPDAIRPSLIPFIPRLLGASENGTDHALNAHFARSAVHILAPEALRAGGYENEAKLLERHDNLFAAETAATGILRKIESQRRYGEVATPIEWALLRAAKSASLVGWFYSSRNDPLKGVWGDLAYDACATTSAATALYAHLAGSAKAWDLALRIVDEALWVREAGRQDDDF